MQTQTLEPTTQKIHAVIYEKPRCPQCKMTKKWLEDNRHTLEWTNLYYGNENETNVIDINATDEKKKEWSLEKVSKLKAKYQIQQLPFIKIVDENNNVLDSWAGFRPNKLNEWQDKIK